MSKVVVGLSGGVDSAVTAYLLKEKYSEVVGVTLKMWKDAETSINDARLICKAIGIHHEVLDFTDEFRREVVDYFINEYLCGRTPNPCCMCNRTVKFEALINWAKGQGIDYIATGHYAKVIRLDNGRYTVRKSVTDTKDQTYALYNLTQEELSHVITPLGDYTKEEVRQIAKNAGIPVAKKKDSQDICFIPDGDYAKFLREYASERIPSSGNFLDENGNIIGKHTGYTDYTIGQRRGLNIAAGHRIFVKEIRPLTNEVIISDEDVYFDSLMADKVNYMACAKIENPTRLFAKIRYAHKGEWCLATPTEDGRLSCVFENKVRAVTPGQAVVFYDNDSLERQIICGATIV